MIVSPHMSVTHSPFLFLVFYFVSAFIKTHSNQIFLDPLNSTSSNNWTINGQIYLNTDINQTTCPFYDYCWSMNYPSSMYHSINITNYHSIAIRLNIQCIDDFFSSNNLRYLDISYSTDTQSWIAIYSINVTSTTDEQSIIYTFNSTLPNHIYIQLAMNAEIEINSTETISCSINHILINGTYATSSPTISPTIYPTIYPTIETNAQQSSVLPTGIINILTTIMVGIILFIIGILCGYYIGRGRWKDSQKNERDIENSMRMDNVVVSNKKVKKNKKAFVIGSAVLKHKSLNDIQKRELFDNQSLAYSRSRTMDYKLASINKQLEILKLGKSGMTNEGPGISQQPPLSIQSNSVLQNPLPMVGMMDVNGNNIQISNEELIMAQLQDQPRTRDGNETMTADIINDDNSTSDTSSDTGERKVDYIDNYRYMHNKSDERARLDMVDSDREYAAKIAMEDKQIMQAQIKAQMFEMQNAAEFEAAGMKNEELVNENIYLSKLMEEDELQQAVYNIDKRGKEENLKENDQKFQSKLFKLLNDEKLLEDDILHDMAKEKKEKK